MPHTGPGSVMHPDSFVIRYVRFCRVCFSFSVLSQDIGWEERLQNDLFYVGWDINP